MVGSIANDVMMSERDFMAASIDHEPGDTPPLPLFRRSQRSPNPTPGACGDAARGSRRAAPGPPGVGKSHLAAALGHALIDAGYRVLFTRTTDLVQQLQAARQELRLAATIEKLDKYHLLVLDDLSYVQKSRPRPACSSS